MCRTCPACPSGYVKLQIFFRKIEDFEKDFLLINVEYDGRKREITDEDIFKTMHKNELVERKGESMFGGFYLATDKLNSQYIIKNAR